MLKENGCQESIVGKIFQRITNNHSFSQFQATDIQEHEIRMSINLPYVECTSEKLRYSRFTFYTASTLCKLPCKLKDRLATFKLKDE